MLDKEFDLGINYKYMISNVYFERQHPLEAIVFYYSGQS